MKLLCITGLFFLSFTFACGQESSKPVIKKALIGEWIAYKKTDDEGSDGREVTFDGEPYSTDLRLNFSNEKVKFYQAGTEYDLTYKIKDGLIFIGNTKFKVMKITEEQLIIKEEVVFGFTYLLKKKI